MNAVTKTTTGSLTFIAGNDVNINAAMTVTTGNMVLRADNDGTGPGVSGGAVAITCGSNCLTIRKSLAGHVVIVIGVKPQVCALGDTHSYARPNSG